jgi:acetyltransferase-like isoleucine patch superfamily enzyme
LVGWNNPKISFWGKRNIKMVDKARQLVEKLRQIRARKLLEGSVMDGTQVLPGFNLEIRAGPKQGRVTIGANSILACKIILERETGCVTVGNNTFIGSSHIICAERIEIGTGVLISWGCTIVDHDSHSLDWWERMEDIKRWREGLVISTSSAAALKNWQSVSMSPIRIGDKAWLGLNVLVLKGVTIGDGSVVAAGSVVTRDVPEWTLVGGNPARVIRELPRERPADA